jgi:hypothetical protein
MVRPAGRMGGARESAGAGGAPSGQEAPEAGTPGPPHSLSGGAPAALPPIIEPKAPGGGRPASASDAGAAEGRQAGGRGRRFAAGAGAPRPSPQWPPL